MSLVGDVKFSLNVVLSKQKDKVLFAEVGSDFADVLLSFLTLSLGTIVRVLKEHYGEDNKGARVNFGSLTSLYKGVANLDSIHFKTNCSKEMLLYPKSLFEDESPKLKLNINESFACKKRIFRSGTCICGAPKKMEIGAKYFEAAANGDCGVFTPTNTESFIITDGLLMFPHTTGFIQTIKKLGIDDMDLGETRNVTFGSSGMMDLLKGALLSSTPLSDVILKKERLITLPKQNLNNEFNCTTLQRTVYEFKKVDLTLIVQESTNRFLFAQAGKEMVDFLFGLLKITLGDVQCLLGSNSCLKRINNLYKSIEDPGSVRASTRRRIMEPKMTNPNGVLHVVTSSILEVQGQYVKGPKMYNIADDLTVTPFSTASTISILKGLKIPFSDIVELPVEIRLQEALSILKASLTSTSAITDGLMINSMLKKKRKRRWNEQ
ncbi:hypothetical protein ACP275_13G018700 [Erythranthe tilingii]